MFFFLEPKDFQDFVEFVLISWVRLRVHVESKSSRMQQALQAVLESCEQRALGALELEWADYLCKPF